LVLDRGKDGQKEKCSRNTGREENGTKKEGEGGRRISVLKFQEEIDTFSGTAL